MLSSVGLEVMNSANSELNWKTVTKGRRSRKSIARSLNGVAKVGNSTSPKRVGDFSGSDSDKFGEVVLGQSSTSGKSESVPIKKRRHLLESPLPHPWTPSLRRQDSASPQTHSSSLSLEDHAQLLYPSGSSGQRFFNDGTKREYNDAGDFSGIELLAAAASMDDDAENANKEDGTNKEDLFAEDSLIPKNSDDSSSATQSKLDLKHDESNNSSSNMTVHGGKAECSVALNNSAAASQSLCGSPEDGTMPKVSRHHWDLNTLMDAWDEPYDDSVAENASKDVNDDMDMEAMEKGPKDHSDQGGARDESSNLRTEENKLATVSPDSICSKPPGFEHLQEPHSSSYSNAAIEISDRAAEKDADERNLNQASNSDAHMETSDQVMATNAICDTSLLTKLCSTSGMSMSEEKINTVSSTVAVADDAYYYSNMSEYERPTASDRVQKMTRDALAPELPSSELSESANDVQQNNTKDLRNTSELPGTFIQDAPPVLIADSNMPNGGTFVSGSAIADRQGHTGPAELVAKHETNNLHNEGSHRNSIEDYCRSSSAGAIDDRHDSDVSEDNHAHMVGGDDLARFQEGSDSPFEDGELRGSFLYSWEDNELENECVDYESDGRNGDGSDAAVYPGSEIIEGGLEGCHGAGRRSLLVKSFPEGVSKSGPIKHSLRRHFVKDDSVKDDSDNNEIAGKGSNAGSGTTVEQSLEMVIEENDNGMKMRQSADRRDRVDLKVTQIDEYTSKTAKGKLQSRIEGLSSMDATDGRGDFFIQQCRSHHRGGSYSRPERDISPDNKYLGRYRPATHGERDGVHQWTSWGSRTRFTSNYHGAEGRSHTRPRNKTGDSADKTGGLDFHGPRQTANYMSKGLHRPFIRRSPVERDDYSGVGRRMPLTRGVSNYRGRGGHYSQRAGRDFGEGFDPLPDDAAGPPVRMPRYFSRKERSFSPGPGRSAHMPLPRRRSRSRSRTRSPRAWHSNRGRILNNSRRYSRSPDFRSEARMERMRVPFTKPTFASDYGEGYVSPSRGRFSPQRNYNRWDDDRSFADNHTRRRRSPPTRVFRPRTQRFDAVGPSGRLNRDEYCRPMVRPRKFSFVAADGSGGRGCKLEANYDGRRHDDGGEMMHRGMQTDDGPNIRRFRQNATHDFETGNFNDEGEVQVTEDVPQTQGGDGEDKIAFEI